MYEARLKTLDILQQRIVRRYREYTKLKKNKKTADSFFFFLFFFLLFFSVLLSIIITSLAEERAGLYASRPFACVTFLSFFPLPLGVGDSTADCDCGTP